MARVYDSTSEPLDFCKKHFPTEERAFKAYGNLGEGPDGRGNCFGYDSAHPDYEGEDYHCLTCGKLLGTADN